MQHPKCCVPSFPKALSKGQRHAGRRVDTHERGHVDTHEHGHMHTHQRAQLSLAAHHTLHCPGAAADPIPSSPTSQAPPGPWVLPPTQVLTPQHSTLGCSAPPAPLATAASGPAQSSLKGVLCFPWSICYSQRGILGLLQPPCRPHSLCTSIRAHPPASSPSKNRDTTPDPAQEHGPMLVHPPGSDLKPRSRHLEHGSKGRHFPVPCREAQLSSLKPTLTKGKKEGKGGQ